MYRVRRFSVLVVLLGIASAGGCAATRQGPIAAVQPTSDRDRAGNVYLLRGFIGIFSVGINDLGDKLNDAGVRAHVYQTDQWRALAREMAREYDPARVPPERREPLVLVGHSYGADDIVRISRYLDRHGVKVDLLVTLDPVTAPKVPQNVHAVVNLYQSNGVWDRLPWTRGVPLRPETEVVAARVQNVDMRSKRPDLVDPTLNHFNIEKRPQIHAEVVSQVLAVCPPRPQWATRHRPPGQPPQVATADRSREPAVAADSASGSTPSRAY